MTFLKKTKTITINGVKHFKVGSLPPNFTPKHEIITVDITGETYLHKDDVWDIICSEFKEMIDINEYVRKPYGDGTMCTSYIAEKYFMTNATTLTKKLIEKEVMVESEYGKRLKDEYIKKGYQKKKTLIIRNALRTFYVWTPSGLNFLLDLLNVQHSDRLHS